MIDVDNSICGLGMCEKPATKRLRGEMNVPVLQGPLIMWFCDHHGDTLLSSDSWELVEERQPWGRNLC